MTLKTPLTATKHDPANSTHPDRPHNHDVHTTSHIRTDIIQTRVDPVRVGGGFGDTFGRRIDNIIGDCLMNNQRVAALSIVITEDDWDALRGAMDNNDDVAVKDA